MGGACSQKVPSMRWLGSLSQNTVFSLAEGCRAGPKTGVGGWGQLALTVVGLAGGCRGRMREGLAQDGWWFGGWVGAWGWVGGSTLL